MSEPDMLVIAIDGPAGAGKSTLAAALARELGLAQLDTGAMYRAVAAGALHFGVDTTDTNGLVALARALEVRDDGAMVVQGLDVTGDLRSEVVTTSVSKVAATPEVRTVLVAHQRTWAVQHGGGVAEGRDMATVVFPDARLKLYLTADEQTRASRRIEEGAASIARRDHIDSTRAASPLQLADGAIVIDTTNRSVATIVDEVLALLGRDEGARDDVGR